MLADWESKQSIGRCVVDAACQSGSSTKSRNHCRFPCCFDSPRRTPSQYHCHGTKTLYVQRSSHTLSSMRFPSCLDIYYISSSSSNPLTSANPTNNNNQSPQTRTQKPSAGKFPTQDSKKTPPNPTPPPLKPTMSNPAAAAPAPQGAAPPPLSNLIRPAHVLSTAAPSSGTRSSSTPRDRPPTGKRTAGWRP